MILFLLIAVFSFSKTVDSTTLEVLKSKANIVVSKDGSGDYKTISEAITMAPDNSMTRFIIYIKSGEYDEIVRIGKTKTNLTLVGDGRDATILTGSLNAKDGIKTYYSATLGVDGENFMAQDLCIQNTAGPENDQAVALRISADFSVLYRCGIKAYQDTLYAHLGRQFYRECYITGTVDFIFGHALAVFQYCQIEARKPMLGQSNVITAQSRQNLVQSSGFSIQRCNITASSDLLPVKQSVKTFLGRPWEAFSTVVVMESFIDDVIDPIGWIPWNTSNLGLNTVYYGEYNNRGPGSETRRRVQWKGHKLIKNPEEAEEFTVAKLFKGDLWLNNTGVPHDEGL